MSPPEHHTCRRCVHHRTPGLSAGYCGGPRDDLPRAYGTDHPLRVLPPDRGRDCAHYVGRW